MNTRKIPLFILFGIPVLAASFFVFHHRAPIVSEERSGNTTAAEVPKPSVATVPAPVPSFAKTCPDGFVLVPGNPLFRTEDFCLMKYEAKCSDVSDPAHGLEPATGSSCAGGTAILGNDTYRNSGKNCACTGSRQVVSTASGYPIAYIAMDNGTMNNAKRYCESMGWHLVTNDEWMTVARNVEQVPANWCDRDGTDCGATPGTVGKILANGHNDDGIDISHDGKALVAGTDDRPCFGTAALGGDTCGETGSQKRTLALDNGSILWDFAGNVWEWVDATVARKDEPSSATKGVRDTGWLKSDFAPGSLPSVITDNGHGTTMGYDAFRPSDPTWNAKNGVGRIYHYSSVVPDTDTTAYAFIRGGNWRHGDDDGAFTIHLSPVPSHFADDLGFRCAAPAR